MLSLARSKVAVLAVAAGSLGSCGSEQPPVQSSAVQNESTSAVQSELITSKHQIRAALGETGLKAYENLSSAVSVACPACRVTERFDERKRELTMTEDSGKLAAELSGRHFYGSDVSWGVGGKDIAGWTIDVLARSATEIVVTFKSIADVASFQRWNQSIALDDQIKEKFGLAGLKAYDEMNADIRKAYPYLHVTRSLANNEVTLVDSTGTLKAETLESKDFFGRWGASHSGWLISTSTVSPGTIVANFQSMRWKIKRQ